MKINYFWKPFLWLAIICYALFIPANELPMKPLLNIPYFDKIVHFSLFFVLCLLLLSPFKRAGLKFYVIAPLISIIISGILEFSQHSISKTRASDIYDFMANTTGVLVSVLFYYFFVSNKSWEKYF